MIALVLLAGVASADQSPRISNWSTPGASSYADPQLEAAEADPLPQVRPVVSTEPGARISSGSTFFVSRIELAGSSVLDAATVRATVAPYEGQQASIETLQAVRQVLTQAYLDRGYINSGVVIPDQEVSGGIIKMTAIEGSLTDVTVERQGDLAAGYIEGRVRRHVLKPLNVDDLRYAIRRLNQDQHVERVEAHLEPGGSPGESVLRLGVDAERQNQIIISADNHGASSFGEWTGRTRLSLSNLSGWGDTLSFGWGRSTGSDSFDLSARLPITHADTSLEVYGSRSDAGIIEDAFRMLDIQSETDTWGVRVAQPFALDLQNRVTASLGYEVKHSRTELLGIPFSFSPGAINGDSRTTSIVAGLDYDRRTSNSVLITRLTYRHGLGDRGANRYAPKTALDTLRNPTGTDGNYELWQLQALALFRLNQLPILDVLHDRAQLLIRFIGQKSDDPLMSLEKFAVGGVGSVRGYPENLLVRDHATTGTIEVQIPIPGYVGNDHWRNLVLNAFWDYGQAWDEADVDPLSPDRDTSRKRRITSIGLGFMWRPLPRVQLEAYWGEDISDNFRNDDPRDFARETDLQSDGVHISLSYGWTL